MDDDADDRDRPPLDPTSFAATGLPAEDVDHTVEFGGDLPVRRIELGVLAFALPAVAARYV
ncbi:hypothetical protein BRD05_04665 [Halobacteriales archaeon QS_9_70_65]|nr:MAG: hypothetical protein BRD05_04665 [Halobacteriales archaeon QS_9_70_65]